MNLKIFASFIDGETTNQIYTLAKTDAFKDSKIRIMPDTHAGKGCVVGFTSNFTDKIIPNVIGVDIGCGVRVVNLGKKEIDLKELDEFIHKFIPSGADANKFIQKDFNFKRLYCYDELKNKDILALQLSSLGGGNHFIEIDKDDEDNKYLIVHTGSRNLGCQVANIYQKKAIKYCHFDIFKEKENKLIEEYKKSHKESLISEALIQYRASCKEKSLPEDLCYLEGKNKDDYLHDMRICQEYAKLNRELICNKIKKFLKIQKLDEFESVHNYIGDDDIMRKGSISAYKDEKVIIPLNMRDGSIIGVGLGNEDWNYSAPHGAGRSLSRSEAKSLLTLKEYEEQMKDVYSTTVNLSTIDESPMAYKDSKNIIELVKDTVKINKIIASIYNFKASE